MSLGLAKYFFVDYMFTPTQTTWFRTDGIRGSPLLRTDPKTSTDGLSHPTQSNNLLVHAGGRHLGRSSLLHTETTEGSQNT